MKPVIKKAVFPVAGLGTRFLPATKASPKEMLPIVDKPLVQYAVEEAIQAGVTQLIFITSISKRAIEDHFDSNFESEHTLEQRTNYAMLALVKNILPKNVSCVYLRQPNPNGLGAAVLCAKDIIGNEPFAVLLADDLIFTEEHGCLQRMVEQFTKVQHSIVAVESVAPEETNKYGIVELMSANSSLIKTIVEKPDPAVAPSNLAAIGRYILTPSVFQELEKIESGADGEVQLTDALARLLHKESVGIHQLHGKRFDCGSKLGYLKATLHYACHHPEIGSAFQSYLDTLYAKCD